MVNGDADVANSIADIASSTAIGDIGDGNISNIVGNTIGGIGDIIDHPIGDTIGNTSATQWFCQSSSNVSPVY